LIELCNGSIVLASKVARSKVSPYIALSISMGCVGLGDLPAEDEVSEESEYKSNIYYLLSTDSLLTPSSDTFRGLVMRFLFAMMSGTATDCDTLIV
jgi:hypothetical protein